MRLNRPNERRGIILLVVLALLTLFAIVGVAFVLYSDYEATAARVAREAESQQKADVDPEQALAFFLGQFIYDVNDNVTGVGSGLRGHSLARSMYGYNYPAIGTPGVNVVPFSGAGRLHYTNTTAFGQDDYMLVNYTWFSSDGFLRDPERYGTRASAGAAQSNSYVAANAPYTYPDLNNFFLAAMNASGQVLVPSFHRPWLFNPGRAFNDMTNPNWVNAQGKYLTLRPRPNEHPGFPIPDDATGDVKSLPGAPGGNDSIWIDLGAPVMTAPDGTQYKMLFAPLIIDLDGRVNLNTAGNILGPGNLHVSNQGWGPWAVNLAKVLYGDNAASPTEYMNIIQGRTMPAGNIIFGRYVPGSPPTPTTAGGVYPGGPYPSPTSTASHGYAPVDGDGLNNGASPYSPSSRPTPPGYTGGPTYGCFPNFGSGYLNGTAAEYTNHPGLFDVFRSPLSNLPTRIFRPSDMEALLRPNSITGNPVDANSSALISDLLQLSPTNLSASASSPRFRNLVTALSMELGQPGVIPYWWNMNGTSATPYPMVPYPPAGATTATAPASLGVPFPTPVGPYPATPTLPPITNTAGSAGPPAVPPNASEFGADWKAVSAALNRIKMNRPLPSYPHMGSGQIPPYNAAVTPYGMSYDTTKAPINSQFMAALGARQSLANDLYRRLLALTGITPVLPANTAAPLPTDLAPRRWLAQLAVNIVDFIDEDDINTPFNFYTTGDGLAPAGIGAVQPALPLGDDTVPTGANPTYWVFGTELPKVVLNEALAEAKNSSPTIAGLADESVKVWLELYNTMPAATPANAQAQDSYRVPLYMPLPSGGGYSPYRVTITQYLMSATTVPPLPDATANVLGKAARTVPASPLPQSTTDVDFSTPATTVGGGAQGAFTVPGSGNLINAGVDPYNPATPGTGYFLIGPPAPIPTTYQEPFVAAGGMSPGVPGATPVVRTASMQYTPVWPAASITDERTTGVTVMLRRLANPYLPFNSNPSITDAMGNISPNPYYNPYITVDYISNVPVQTNTPAMTACKSRGKRQPYAAYTQVPVLAGIPQAPAGSDAGPPPVTNSPVVNQQLNAAPPPSGAVDNNNVTHTFGMQNFPVPPSGSYDWLVHLDRPVISAIELLHVSGYQPHQLTQQFIRGNNTSSTNMFQHYVPWLDSPPAGATLAAPWWFDATLPIGQTHRLSRLFEFLECGDRAFGVDGLGRIPGRVNINTMWTPDYEILRAICDANTSLGPNITDAQIDAIFNNLMASRTPGGTPGPSDRPFLPLSTGLVTGGGTQFPNGIGVQTDTILRLGPAGAQQLFLFQNPNDATPPNAMGPPTYWHPYLQTQLLTKIYNNITTRSNTFALFLTVGFFQVTNAAASPPTLGAEIGRSEGRQIRHRMFAIIDRTNLSVGSTTYTGGAISVTAGGAPQTVTVALGAMSGTNPYTGAPWNLTAGSWVVFDPGTDNEETVLLNQPGAGTPVAGALQATFYKSHATGATVIIRGNPGPWRRYDPRLDPLVVPYYSIID